jgi:hypothetical protein
MRRAAGGRRLESLYPDGMGAILDLRRCGDLNEEHAHEAAGSPRDLSALLERVAQVARPGDGGAALLSTLARVADSSTWIDGGISNEITGDDVDSTLEIFSDHGATRERVVPATSLAVPVDEFIAAVESGGDVVGSLRVEVGPHKLVLTTRVSGEISVDVNFEIADDSLKVEARDTRPAPPDFDAPRRMSGMHERFNLLVDDDDDALEPKTVYTKTTVPKMIAVTPEAIARFDARREPED